MVRHVRIPNELRGELLRRDEPFGDEDDDLALNLEDVPLFDALPSDDAEFESRCRPSERRATTAAGHWNSDATSRGHGRTMPGGQGNSELPTETTSNK